MSEAAKRHDKPQEVPQLPWLLVSDIDDTLTGDEEALTRLLEIAAASPRLLVALNSSRPRESVEKTLAAFPVPFHPAGLVTAMGTEVAVDGKPVRAWQERFADWDRGVVDEVMRGLGAVPHPDEFQTRFKASYSVEGGLQTAARESLANCGQGVSIVVSGASDFDILPPRAGKGPATVFLASTLKVSLSYRLIVAGDSGNDLAMFEVAPRGILVGNAREELCAAVQPDSVYKARAPHAAGVLEGLRHWGAPLTDKHPPSGKDNL